MQQFPYYAMLQSCRSDVTLRAQTSKLCFVFLQEMVENMDSTRDVWAMQLDTIRNRIIRVELLVAVASFSLMVSTVPASFFGMNLTSGIEVGSFVPFPQIVLSCLLKNKHDGVYCRGNFHGHGPQVEL